MTEAPPRTPPPPRPRSTEEEAEALVREFTHDSIVLARRGLRVAARLGSKALKKAEEVTDQVADDVRAARRKGSNPRRPRPPRASLK